MPGGEENVGVARCWTGFKKITNLTIKQGHLLSFKGGLHRSDELGLYDVDSVGGLFET